MINPPKELRQFLARHDAAIRSLTFGLRAIVVDELAPCHEYVFAMRSKVVLLYSASARVISDGICNIGVFRRHVTLTFVEGTDLDDPSQLLLGSGKIMRHLRIASPEELARPELRAFLRQARILAGLAPSRDHGQRDVITRVKRPSTLP